MRQEGIRSKVFGQRFAKKRQCLAENWTRPRRLLHMFLGGPSQRCESRSFCEVRFGNGSETKEFDWLGALQNTLTLRSRRVSFGVGWSCVVAIFKHFSSTFWVAARALSCKSLAHRAMCFGQQPAVDAASGCWVVDFLGDRFDELIDHFIYFLELEHFGVLFGELLGVGPFEQPGGGSPVGRGSLSYRVQGSELGG